MPTLLAALFLLAALSTPTCALTRSYERGKIVLTPNVADVWFTVRPEANKVDLALSLKLPQNIGSQWVALGVSSRGSRAMRNANLFTVLFEDGKDTCIGYQDRPVSLVPSLRWGKTATELAPVNLDRGLNSLWNLHSCARAKNGTIVLEVTRDLSPVVPDPSEHAISSGETHLLYAYGANSFSSHTTRASTPIIFLKASKATANHLKLHNDFSNHQLFQIGKTNCTSIPFNQFDESYTMVVGVKPENIPSVVTRIIVYGCEKNKYTTGRTDRKSVAKSCRKVSPGINEEARCNTLFYSWAQGVGTLNFPKDVGISLTPKNRIVVMEIEAQRELTANEGKGGVRLYFTKASLTHKSGTLALGDPTHQLDRHLLQDRTIPCNSRCTKNIRKKINMFAVHMHGSRYLKKIDLRRGNSDDTFDLTELAKEDNFSHTKQKYQYFDKRSLPTLRENQNIELRCEFDGSKSKESIRFGRGVYNAACQAYIHYWPAVERFSNDGSLFYCAFSYNEKGKPAILCGAGWRPKSERNVDLTEPDTCFPSDATVTRIDGSVVRMHDLAVGDHVQVSPGVYSPVFTFTHSNPSVKSQFVVIRFAGSSRTLALAGGHLVYRNSSLVRADEVRPGDWMETAIRRRITVSGIDSQMLTGLYNPHTLHGDIIVNGIRASTFTQSVKPAVAQSLLAPLRSMYRSFGLTIIELLCGNQSRKIFLWFRELFIGLLANVK